jgi:hypothetical protein
VQSTKYQSSAQPYGIPKKIIVRRVLTDFKKQLKDLVARGYVRSEVVLLVLTVGYEETFRLWLGSQGAPSKKDILIVACDEKSFGFYKNEGFTTLSTKTDGTREDLWRLRTEVFAELSQLGVDFFHTDADAIWRKDPREYCRAQIADLVVSQGTICPKETCRAWGFVLCCGFFYARATKNTAAILQKAAEHCDSMLKAHDQVALNTVLLEAGCNWNQSDETSERRQFQGEVIRFFNHPIYGECKTPKTRVCLLPLALFDRMGLNDENCYVEHILKNKKCEKDQE